MSTQKNNDVLMVDIDTDPVEVAVLDQYLGSKGVRQDCVQCGKKDGWSKYISPNGPVSLPVMLNGDVLIGGGCVETLAMRCNNCGYILLFDYEMFLDWREKEGQ